MKRIAITVLTLAITATVGSAFASAQEYRNDSRSGNAYNHPNSQRNDVAQVIRVQRINNQYGDNQYSYERQECWNEQTNDYDDGYYRDSSGRLYRGDANKSTKSTSGAVIGAIVGGALGNQVGKGDGRDAATVAGAVIGATVGAKVGNNTKHYEYRDNDSGTVRRCRTVYDNDHNSDYGHHESYNVTYRYAGQVYRTVTNYRPGRTIRVVVSVTPRDDGNRYGNRN